MTLIVICNLSVDGFDDLRTNKLHKGTEYKVLNLIQVKLLLFGIQRVWFSKEKITIRNHKSWFDEFIGLSLAIFTKKIAIFSDICRKNIEIKIYLIPVRMTGEGVCQLVMLTFSLLNVAFAALDGNFLTFCFREFRNSSVFKVWKFFILTQKPTRMFSLKFGMQDLRSEALRMKDFWIMNSF